MIVLFTDGIIINELSLWFSLLLLIQHIFVQILPYIPIPIRTFESFNVLAGAGHEGSISYIWGPLMSRMSQAFRRETFLSETGRYCPFVRRDTGIK